MTNSKKTYKKTATQGDNVPLLSIVLAMVSIVFLGMVIWRYVL